MAKVEKRRNKRSKTIRLVKLILPLLAIVMLSTIFLWSKYNYDVGTVLSSADRDALNDGLKLLKPQFSGKTNKGEAYQITADWALPDGLDPNEVKLENLRGSINMKDGRDAEITANDAEWHRLSDVFLLKGGVKLSTNDGYLLTTEKASIDLELRRVVSGSAVEIDGPSGNIKADKMTLGQLGESDNGQNVGRYVRFEGNVKMYIEPSVVKDTK